MDDLLSPTESTKREEVLYNSEGKNELEKLETGVMIQTTEIPQKNMKSNKKRKVQGKRCHKNLRRKKANKRQTH